MEKYCYYLENMTGEPKDWLDEYNRKAHESCFINNPNRGRIDGMRIIETEDTKKTVRRKP